MTPAERARLKAARDRSIRARELERGPQGEWRKPQRGKQQYQRPTQK